jgi:BirA family biotin operon repressor/biotin-[acetyl-CoA-carboxylase] ligase
MSQLSGDLIRHKLPTFTFGQSIIYTPQTGSTNTELKKFARQGAPEGMLYITDEQLVGRGRLSRSWVAPPESSLLMSVLFRPTFLEAAQMQQLTMVCCLAMLEAIAKHTGLEPLVKWPNDIIWTDHKKLAGMLTEAEFERDHLSWVVVGLGVNVNVDFSQHTTPEPDRPQQPGSGHPPLANTATSLSTILGRDTDDLRLPLVQSYLRHIEQRYEALQHGVSPHFEWQRKLADVGKEVTVTQVDGGRQHRGTVTGVNENGALRLRQADDSIISVYAGDVTLR